MTQRKQKSGDDQIMQESNSKKSGCVNLILLGTFAVVTFGAGYWYSRNILGQELTPNSGAKILPENVVMTSFVSTDVNKWSKISKFGTAEAQKLISQNLSQLEKEINRKNLDINYQQDIQPWLGGIMFAVLPSQENPNYDLVTIIGIKDKFQAWNFVENVINKGIIGSEITPKTEAELKQVKSIVAGIGIEDNSLHFRGIANLNQPLDLNTIKPVSPNLLQQLPQDTILMVNGNKINQAWSKISENSKTIPELDEVISQSREQFSHWLKLDLDQDIFSWIDGEFAFGLFPVNNNNLAGLVLLETSDRSQGEITLSKLENLSNQIPFLFIEEQTIEGITVKEWTTLQHSFLSYGWVDNNSLLIDSIIIPFCEG